jgi:hypothetical protein
LFSAVKGPSREVSDQQANHTTDRPYEKQFSDDVAPFTRQLQCYMYASKQCMVRGCSRVVADDDLIAEEMHWLRYDNTEQQVKVHELAGNSCKVVE